MKFYAGLKSDSQYDTEPCIRHFVSRSRHVPSTLGLFAILALSRYIHTCMYCIPNTYICYILQITDIRNLLQDYVYM